MKHPHSSEFGVPVAGFHVSAPHGPAALSRRDARGIRKRSAPSARPRGFDRAAWPGGVPPPIGGAAANVVNKTNGAGAADTNAYTTASVTFTAGKVYLLSVGNAATVTATAPSSITGTGTWTQVATVQFSVTTAQLTVLRYAPASTTSGTVTINFAANQVRCCWSIDELASDNGGTNGANAVVQSVTNSGLAGNTASATLAAFNHTANGTFGAAMQKGPNAWVVGSGFTGLCDIRAPSENGRLITEYKTANDTVADATTTGNPDWGFVAIEYKRETRSGTGAAGANADLRTHLKTTRTSGSRAETPDHASLEIATRVGLFAAVSLDNWTVAPHDFGLATEVLIGKHLWTGNQRAYALAVSGTSGKPRLTVYWSNNGTADLSIASVVDLPVSGGSLIAVGVDLNTNNGAAQKVASFYWKNLTLTGDIGAQIADATGWTLLETITQATASSIFTTGTAKLVVGGMNDGLNFNMAGRTLAACVKSGGLSGSVVANPDFSKQKASSTTFTDAAGRAWTVAGGAAINGVSGEKGGKGAGTTGLSIETLNPGYVVLDGVSDYVSTPDSTTLTNVDEFVLAAAIAPDVYDSGATQTIVAKYDNTGPARSWALVMGAGLLQFLYSANGSSASGLASTSKIPQTPGRWLSVRGKLNISTGAWSLEYRAFDEATYMADLRSSSGWTTLTSGSGATSADLFNSSVPITVGSDPSVLGELTGKIRGAVVKYDGTTIVDADYGQRTHATDAFVDAAGKTWSVNGNASYVLPSPARGTKGATAASAITATSSVTATGRKDAAAASAISQASTVTATGEPRTAGEALIASTANLAGTATTQRSGAATPIAIASTVTAAGRKEIATPATDISHATAATAAGTTDRLSSATIALTTDTDAAGQGSPQGAAFLASSAILTETHRTARAGTAALSHSSAVTAAGRKNASDDCDLSHSTATSAAGVRGQIATALITVASSVVATATTQRRGAATIAVVIVITETGEKSVIRVIGPTAIIAAPSITKVRTDLEPTLVTSIRGPTRIEVVER